MKFTHFEPVIDEMSYNAEWAKRNYLEKEERRLAIRESNRKRKGRIQTELAFHKINAGCAACGFNSCPKALEFHHSDGIKEFTIAAALGLAEDRIWAEVGKCIVLCANCHRANHCGCQKTGVHGNSYKIRSPRERPLKGRPMKIDWPSIEDLKRMVEETSYVAVGRELGVSDNAVRKHIKTRAGAVTMESHGGL